MPRVNFDTKQDFDAHYNVNGEPDGRPSGRQQIRLGYCRCAMLPYAETRAAKLVELFGWPTSTKILIVGAGFNLTGEVLEADYGYTNVVGIDTSSWIQSSQNTDEEQEYRDACTAAGVDPDGAEGTLKRDKMRLRARGAGNRRRHSRLVENEGLQNNGSRNRVRNLLGDLDVGITESVLESLDDSEVTTLSSRVDQINAGIQRIHLVSELNDYPVGDKRRSIQDPAFNWKTIEQWKVLLPSDTIVSLNDWDVV